MSLAHNDGFRHPRISCGAVVLHAEEDLAALAVRERGDLLRQRLRLEVLLGALELRLGVLAHAQPSFARFRLHARSLARPAPGRVALASPRYLERTCPSIHSTLS